jgi:hypothetical protein
MGCLSGKESNNSDSPYTELFNAICNLAYRKNITKQCYKEEACRVKFSVKHEFF